jgi:hypothetical protein
MELMYIGAALKKALHNPKIHDCDIDRKDFNNLKHTITALKPGFIGISIIIT